MSNALPTFTLFELNVFTGESGLSVVGAPTVEEAIIFRLRDRPGWMVQHALAGDHRPIWRNDEAGRDEIVRAARALDYEVEVHERAAASPLADPPGPPTLDVASLKALWER